MMVIGLVSFLGFTVLGPALAHLNMSARPAAVVVDAVILGACVVLRRLRFSAARSLSLEFEDTLPTEVNPLRLNTD